MIRRLSATVLAAGLLLLAPALLGAAPPAQIKGLIPLRMMVFSPAPALVAASEQGYLAAEGLDLTIGTTNSSAEQMQVFAAGQWDVVSTLFDNLLAAATREGVQAVAFAVVDIRDLSLFVRPEITGYEDLSGRRVGVDAPDTANALVLRRLLLAHGLDPVRGDYELVAIGGQGLRLDSVRRGDTDA